MKTKKIGLLSSMLAAWLTAVPAFADDGEVHAEKNVVKPTADIVEGKTEEKAFDTCQPSQEKKSDDLITFDFKIDYPSKYLLRGFTLSETPVIQSTLSATYKNFTVIGFGNVDTLTGQLNEADITFDYTHRLDIGLIVSAGYTYLTFPNTELRKTQEAYCSVTHDDELLRPSLKIVRDFDEGKGNYLEASVSHGFGLGTNAALSITGVIGYNDGNFRDRSGLSHGELGFALPITLGDHVTITPSLRFSKSLDKKNFQDEVYGGVGFNVDF